MNKWITKAAQGGKFVWQNAAPEIKPFHYYLV